MKGFVYFSFLTVLVSGLVAQANHSPLQTRKDVHGRIVGGEDAKEGEFPYIVSIQAASWGHFCGGSLIRPNWVLTAGHCAEGGDIQKVYIGLHKQNEKANAEVFSVKRVITHPKFSNKTLDFDFALVELSGDSRFAPIPLNRDELVIPRQEPSSDIMTTVAGWGALAENSYNLPNVLQKVDVPLVHQEFCEQSYKGKITDRMICAGYKAGGKDSCQGDSGGPLIMKNTAGEHVQIGVVSWGVGCAAQNYYGVYAKINSVNDWIAQTIQ